jgi:ceramide glucosyltransferase
VLVIFPILALLALLLTLWQWVAAWCFPLHRRVADKSFTPGVTVLKPLKGLEHNTMECLRSWLAQDYPAPLEVLFGVASPDDPACAVIRQLLQEHPQADAALVVCPESLGVNGKVSSLIQLQRRAKHGVIIVSDADVLVPADFLVNVVAPLRDDEVGLVNCFYRLVNPTTLAMRWEAVAINADFWSQVLQGASLQPLDFALGAVMVTRRTALEKIGGFEALADYLADDFQLGNRIVRVAGRRIELCPVVVDCISHPMNWREVWSHQLRWARTIRACKPLPYAASILGNPVLWPALWLAVQPSKWSLLFFAGALLIRMVTAQTLQRRLGPVPGQGFYWWLAPVKDALQFALWVCAFAGGSILWRGQRYRLQRDGRLAAATGDSPSISADGSSQVSSR